MHLRVVLSMLAAALVAAVGASAAQASASSIGGFGARPAHFDAAVPATRAYFIHTLPQGGSFSDQVIVFNDGAAPLTFRVYPVDGLTGATSGVVYGNRQNRLAAAGRWVALPQSIVTVPAHHQMPVGFTVRLPAHVHAGAHLAGLAVEVAHPHSSGGRFSVTEVLRTVVGIEINVPGPTHAAIALRSVALAAPQSSATAGLLVSLANVGGRLCKPRLSVRLSGPGGAERVTHQLDTILPGNTIPYPVTWPRALGVGTYGTVVTATGCGKATILNGSVAVRHRLKAAGAAAASSAGTRTTGTPWLLLALFGVGGIAVGGVGFGLALRRGRRRVILEH
jgi:hypothetical protein